MKIWFLFFFFIYSNSFGQNSTNVRCVVLDDHDNVVWQAKVSLFLGASDTSIKTAYTNKKGSCSFDVVIDRNNHYSLLVEQEGYFTQPKVKFFVDEKRTYVIDLKLLKGCTLGKYTPLSFVGLDTKDTTSFKDSGMNYLFFEYPQLVLELIYVPKENEPKYLYRRRVRTFKEYLINNGIEHCRFSFARTEINSSEFCQGCFQGRVVSMDGCN